MIFLSDDGAQVEKDATRDGNQLAAFLDKNETSLRTIRRSAGFYGAVDRLQLSLRTLGQIATYEANRPGKKMLIWVGPGWPILSGPNVELTQKDQQGIFHSIVAASTQLRQSRITLYAVDPLGTTDSGSFRTFYYRSFLKGVSQPRQAQSGNLALQVLAEQSGGRVMNSSNDIAGEIESCVADAEVFYVLSFDPPPGDGPNEYHALEIKLNKPGLTARTRTGYYSQP
jgi:VWFA-related protein